VAVVGKNEESTHRQSWLLQNIWQDNTEANNVPPQHPLFFKAVQQWLDHPRHYEVTRDIGESTLRASDYEEDLASYINPDNDEEDLTLPEKPTTSDEEFIVHSDEDITEASGDTLERLDEGAERVTERLRRKKEAASIKARRSNSNVKSSQKDIRTWLKAAKSSKTAKSKSSPKEAVLKKRTVSVCATLRLPQLSKCLASAINFKSFCRI
jgi:hypothetical protein